MNLERLGARAFVAIGGLLWAAAAFAGLYSYLGEPFFDSAAAAFVPLAITVIALAVGWFYEKLAALLLVLGAVGVIGWGIVASWELGMWLTMGAVMIAPMLIAALLFMLAARMQDICTLEGHVQT
jgi:hypothetical protein